LDLFLDPIEEVKPETGQKIARDFFKPATVVIEEELNGELSEFILDASYQKYLTRQQLNATISCDIKLNVD
jgi:hypothetical protein